MASSMADIAAMIRRIVPRRRHPLHLERRRADAHRRRTSSCESYGGRQDVFQLK